MTATLPLAAPSCHVIPDPPARLSITLPGGFTISAIPPIDGGVATQIGSVQSLMTQAAPALAALAPALMVIDAVVSLFDLVKAVPALVAGDVAGFVEQIETTTEKVGKLLGLVPQVSVPYMVMGAIGMIVAALEALLESITQIESMVTQANAVIAQAQAAGDAMLEAQGNCALQQASQLTKHAGAALGPVGDLLKVVTTLLDFVPGAPAIPSVTDLAGQPLADIKSTIQALLDVLRLIRLPGG